MSELLKGFLYGLAAALFIISLTYFVMSFFLKSEIKEAMREVLSEYEIIIE